MAIREIRVVPDPVLRTPCDEIKEITPAVRRLVDDLLETVDDPGRAEGFLIQHRWEGWLRAEPGTRGEIRRTVR